jgi:putative chitinase
MNTPADWETIIKLIAPAAKPWIVMGLADALPALCQRFDIMTVDRQAHFLGQLAHESDGLRTTVEYADGSAYEGRKDLGNTHRGDGRKFRGRGLIQLTGRANYAAATKALGQDFVGHPERVAEFPAAADVSGWFWAAHNLNRHADADDVKAVTKIINGGLNGLDSRVAYLTAAKGAIA